MSKYIYTFVYVIKWLSFYIFFILCVLCVKCRDKQKYIFLLRKVWMRRNLTWFHIFFSVLKSSNNYKNLELDIYVCLRHIVKIKPQSVVLVPPDWFLYNFSTIYLTHPIEYRNIRRRSRLWTKCRFDDPL